MMDGEYKERIQAANYDEDTSDELETRYCKKTSFDWVKKACMVVIILHSYLQNFAICSCLSSPLTSNREISSRYGRGGDVVVITFLQPHSLDLKHWFSSGSSPV